MPRFFIDNIHINGRDIVELGNNKTTIKFTYDGIEYIKFFCSKEYRKAIYVGEDVDLDIQLIGELSINEWNGNKRKQVVIDKMECSVVGKSETDWEDMF